MWLVSWYLIHTKPREEARALLNLERQGFHCYLPMLSVERMRGGSVVQSEEPLFPRYLFIDLDAGGSGQSWAPIRSTKGVSRLVTFGAEPARIDDRLIALIVARDKAQPQRLFSPGERVTIGDGPFAGVEAVYEMPDGERRAMVLIELLGKGTRFAVPVSELRKLQ